MSTVLRFTDSRGESWCLSFAKEMRLSNVLFENDACFNPHLLTWDPARAKENRVRATLFACLYQQGLEHGWAWRFSDKIVGVCLVFHFYPRIRKEHTDKSCLIPAKLFMSAIRSVSKIDLVIQDHNYLDFLILEDEDTGLCVVFLFKRKSDKVEPRVFTKSSSYSENPLCPKQ